MDILSSIVEALQPNRTCVLDDIATSLSSFWDTEVAKLEEAATKEGKGRNKVVAIGNKFDLYVNRQTIGSVSDSKYQQGIIGLLAHYYNSPVEIVYSDVKAWTL